MNLNLSKFLDNGCIRKSLLEVCKCLLESAIRKRKDERSSFFIVGFLSMYISVGNGPAKIYSAFVDLLFSVSILRSFCQLRLNISRTEKSRQTCLGISVETLPVDTVREPLLLILNTFVTAR